MIGHNAPSAGSVQGRLVQPNANEQVVELADCRGGVGESGCRVGGFELGTQAEELAVVEVVFGVGED